MFFVTPSVSNAESHSHDGRAHNHPLPQTGFHHRHGAGGFGVKIGVGKRPQQKSPTVKKSMGYYYYSLIGGAIQKNDYRKAISLLTKSCNLKFGLACYKLAAFHGAGTKVPKNMKKALQFSGKGCDFNNKKSCRLFGVLFTCKEEMTGSMCSQYALNSSRNDVYFINKACNHGHNIACKMVGSSAYVYPDGSRLGDDQSVMTSMIEEKRLNTYFDRPPSSSGSISESLSSSSSSSSSSAPQRTCRSVTKVRTVRVMGGRPGQTTQEHYSEQECSY